MVYTMLFRIVLYAPILGIGGVLKVLHTDASMTWILGIAVAAILILVAVLSSCYAGSLKATGSGSTV